MSIHQPLAPDAGTDDGYAASGPADDAVSAVRLGIWISAARCLLTYVVAPAAGAVGVLLGPLGLVLQVLGAVTALHGARVLRDLGHRARHLYTFVACAVAAAAVLALAQLLRGLVR